MAKKKGAKRKLDAVASSPPEKTKSDRPKCKRNKKSGGVNSLDDLREIGETGSTPLNMLIKQRQQLKTIAQNSTA